MRNPPDCGKLKLGRQKKWKRLRRAGRSPLPLKKSLHVNDNSVKTSKGSVTELSHDVLPQSERELRF